MTTSLDLREALEQAVNTVNRNAGQTCVRLRFRSEELPELEIMASAASLRGDAFIFQSGLERFDGQVAELADVRAEVIH
ncbi:MAG: hypothetical protein U1D55_03235 [Phycisphaerae bacterium]